MNRWLPVRNRKPLSLFDSWSLNMERMMQEMLGSLEPINYPQGKSREEQEFYLRPRGDFFREDGRIIMEFEIPGLDPEKIDLKVYSDHMEINAVKEQDNKVEKENYLRAERFFGRISRMISFPAEVDPGSAKASYRKGVLRIEVQQIPQIEDSGKRIAIDSPEE